MLQTHGFPADFKIPVSDTQAYKQFGNSVVVPVVQRIATTVLNTFRTPANNHPAPLLPLTR
jgi:DNA (cytosine-5)-methyltransferase 1